MADKEPVEQNADEHYLEIDGRAAKILIRIALDRTHVPDDSLYLQSLKSACPLVEHREVDCRGLDTSDGSRVIWNGYDASESNLSGAYLEQSQFMWTNFSRANISDAVFLSSDVAFANFESADLVNVRFENCHLMGSNFSKSHLANATFFCCNLDGANFDAANLVGANFVSDDNDLFRLVGASFDEANLTKTEFFGTNLSESTFRGANLTGTRFHDLITEDTNFRCSNVSGAVFDGNSWAIDFSYANLEGVLFTESSTSEVPTCDLSGCTFDNANLSGATVEGEPLIEYLRRLG